MHKKVVVSVSNDLATDQRVSKICAVFMDEGYDVLLIGRKRKNSLSLDRPYKTIRFRLLFNTGALFYAALNMRLFWKLLFTKTNVLYANDLDTLLANFLVSKLKRVKLIYDSHEYFTEVPELAGRRFAKGTWLRIERYIFPKLKHVITVNDSIAEIYKKEYNVDVATMRNVPLKHSGIEKDKTRAELNLPIDKKLIILQGAGINVDRGGEELVESMRYVKDAVLLIVGGGDVIEVLKKMVSDFGLVDKVRFIDKMPYKRMMMYTVNADLGATLDKPTNLNYRYSLPNKIFDYLKAGIPVLSSNLIEVARIVNQYEVGVVVENHDPKQLAQVINEFLSDTDRLNSCKANASRVIEELCWENEKAALVNMLH